jgi:hypothetical protein
MKRAPLTDQAVTDDFPRIFSLALERFNTRGRQEYGDALFYKSDAQVIREEMEEILDELMYGAERYRRLEARLQLHCHVGDTKPKIPTGATAGPDGFPY